MVAGWQVGALVTVAFTAGCAVGSPADLHHASDPALDGATVESSDVTLIDAWFIELEEAPLSRGGDPARLAAEKDRFHARASAALIPMAERYRFDRLWNGLSVRADHDSAERLRALPGVKSIHPVVPIVLDASWPRVFIPGSKLRAPSATTDLDTALAMTGADIAQSALGLRGDGVRVGVIDSGIDIHHPDLGGSPAGCFGPGCRVAFGWDFVGDDYDSQIGGSAPVPDAVPDDCGGHGTHVAGIIGASGAVKGVAPGVVFGAYRVFGCAGSTGADVMIAAMERAAADGMRVINMSIGSTFQWPDYPTARAADQLVDDGVVVVCSIGNSGTSGVWAAGAPGVGEKAIGTASFDNTSVTQPAFTLSPDDRAVGFNTATGAPPPPLAGSLPVARTGAVTSVSDACSPLPEGSLDGAAALVRRGTCGFYTKAFNAASAGAALVILYNNQPGSLSTTVSPPVGSEPIGVPVVAISALDGVEINTRLDAGAVVTTWGTGTVSQPSPTGGRVSSFSSHGLAPDLSLKPDLGAPGGSIYSTYPIELGAYASLSGTSMAAPHVSGAVALLLEARPEIPAASVRDRLQNTAAPAPWPGAPGGATRDLCHRQGAGLIHIDAAIQARVSVTPAKLSLGESQAGPASATLTLSNEGPAPVTYDLSHAPAASTIGNYWLPSPAATSEGPAEVVFAAPSVTVPAHGQASVGVTITADPTLAEGALYGGYLVFTPEGGEPRLHVPYAGFLGDYQALPVLTSGGKGYPWLATRSPGGAFTNQPGGRTFTLQSGDVPHVVLHLDRPAARLHIDVRDAVKGKPYGRVIDLEHVGQGTSSTHAVSFAWDGSTTFNKQSYAVPNGTYVLVLSVLKALGDPDDPTHWEIWTSPVATLNHP